jgi:hypothetical protein
MDEKRSAHTTVRLPPQLKNLGKRAAADEERTFNDWLNRVISDHLRRHRYLPPRRRESRA